MTFHKVTDFTVATMEAEKLLEISVGGKWIGMLKKGETVYAFAATCPHAGVSLCYGWLDAQGRIVCPEHKYRFDPVNGRNTSGEGYKLMTYAVEIKDGDIYVGFLS